MSSLTGKCPNPTSSPISTSAWRVSNARRVQPGRTWRIQWTETKDAATFPDYYSGGVGVPPLPLRMMCVAPLSYRGQMILQTDIANLKAAMKANGVDEAFMPSISLSRRRRLPGQQILPLRGRASLRSRRRDA